MVKIPSGGGSFRGSAEQSISSCLEGACGPLLYSQAFTYRALAWV